MTTYTPLRAWAEIDLGALVHNISTLTARYAAGNAGVMAIVKADAYGHGIEIVAPCAYEHGIRHFGCATVDEALLLRKLLRGDAHVYLLSPVLPSDAPEIVENRLIPIISSLEMAQALSAATKAGSATPVHMDIDTGMGRSGFAVNEVASAAEAIEALPGLRLTGVFTHFATADEDHEDACAQHALFLSALADLGPRAGLTVHASNSPASLVVGRPGYHTLVRPGLLLYGIEPEPGMFASCDANVRPVLSLRAGVTLCRDLAPGATISYGKTYAVPPAGGRYATIAIGYGDGLARRLGNNGHVLLRGKRAPIRGRVCMDQCVVDVSDIAGVGAGDVATIIGRDADAQITAGELATLIPTTPHEVTTALLARVPRIPVTGGV